MRLPRTAIIATGFLLPAIVLGLVATARPATPAQTQQHINLSGRTMSKTQTEPTTIAGTPTPTTSVTSVSGLQTTQPSQPTSARTYASKTPATPATQPADSSTPIGTPTQSKDNNQPSGNDTVVLTVPYMTSYTRMSKMVPDPEKGLDWYFNQCSATWNDGHTQTWNIGPPEYYPSGTTGTVSCGAPPAS